MYTVKPPYNDTTYLADRIVIPKVSLYLVFVYKMHQKSKLGNDIIYLRLWSRNWAIGYTKIRRNWLLFGVLTSSILESSLVPQ